MHRTDTFIQLVLQHQDYLQTLANKFTNGDSVKGDDLYQETMLKLLKNQDKFNLNTHFKTWANTVMRNTFINDFRSVKRRRTDCCDTTLPGTPIHAAYTVPNQAPGQLSIESMQREIEKLKPVQQQAMKLHIEGFSYAEIANNLGVMPDRVRIIMFWARQNLQNRLSGQQLEAAS